MSSSASPRPRCERCNLPVQLCLCAEIPRVQTRTRFLILQHLMEMGKKSNTGQLAVRGLGFGYESSDTLSRLINDLATTPHALCPGVNSLRAAVV